MIPLKIRKSSLVLIVLIVLLFALPFHFVFLSTFANIGVSGWALRLLPLWKEVLMCGLFLLLLPKLLPKLFDLKLGVLDLLALCFFVVTVAYSYNAFLLGTRSAVFFFMLPYMLGRLCVITEKGLYLIVATLTFVAMIASASAIIERFLLPADFWARVGLVRYLNFTGFYSPAPYGLPWTFFNLLGYHETGELFRRSGGIFANPLGLAQGLAVLISLPIASILSSKKIKIRDVVLTMMILIAIVLSGSRTNIIAAILVVLLLVLGKRRYDLFFIMSIIACVGMAVLIFSSESVYNFVVNTVTFQEHSARVHLMAWLNGLFAFLEHPFGYGIAASGAIGERVSSNSTFGGESDYIIVLVQKGVLGFGLMVLVRLAGLRMIWKLLALRKQMKPEEATLVCVAFAALLVVVLSGLTSQVSLFPRIVAWLFLGYTYTLARNLKTTRSLKSINRRSNNEQYQAVTKTHASPSALPE